LYRLEGAAAGPYFPLRSKYAAERGVIPKPECSLCDLSLRFAEIQEL